MLCWFLKDSSSQSAPDIIPITCDCPYGMTGHTIHAKPANRPAKRKLPSIPAPLPFRGELKGTGQGVYGKSVPVCVQASVQDVASTMNVPRPTRASNIYTRPIIHRPTQDQLQCQAQLSAQDSAQPTSSPPDSPSTPKPFKTRPQPISPMPSLSAIAFKNNP